jgi:predicted ABC-type transport system involved in lysophospholipase L1 biosynthesis ATPase subunit
MASDREAGDGVAIRADQVRKVYGSKDAHVEALRGISLEIEEGERVALLGKSGSGKSTLLNLFCGLDRPSSRALRVGGRDLHQLSGREMARFRSTTVGMTFQSFNPISSGPELEIELLGCDGALLDKERARTNEVRPRFLAEAVIHLVGNSLAAIRISRSSTRYSSLMWNRATVTRPMAVRPIRRAPSQRKCVAHLLRRD